MEILLNLGIKYLTENNEKNIFLIILIFINIQIYQEGNSDYIKILYRYILLEFYNNWMQLHRGDKATRFGEQESG